MGYDRAVYDTANEILAARRLHAEQEAERRRADLYRVQPRAQEIDRKLSRAGTAAARAVLHGGDVRQNLEQLRRRSHALREELRALLAQQNMTEADLEPHYHCPLCQDRGNIDGRMCRCMKSLLKEEALRRLNADTPLKLCSFESFDVSYYPETPQINGSSPQQMMERIFLYCRKYAETFNAHTTESLLMTGKTGLGKTHLSLAIAGRVTERGFGVVYGSAENLLKKLQDEHFGRSRGDTMNSLLNCDLLILDDLGTEFRSSFTVAAIYNIINSRQLTEKPVIISTNLSLKELTEYYTERFSSRVIGSYTCIPFVGNDVRQMKHR
ncbi:hypothetical protein B6259_06450 [Ruminococcaceae bacterium CPB6]|jgi:DNA replication protein DnaC|uniref:ATP-binding protein n=1 Tax=Caproicibacterium lactatifermentans TaxID=2666138 RepID=UPI000A2934BF|nr:hypothetical protein B6259_06450 [Ruminococcaceae bacterium CPB6]